MINELAHVLRQAAGLVRLDLNVTASAAFSIGTISLPRLTTLVIIEVGPNPTGGNDAGIFGSIHAPSLEIISYNADRHGVQRSPALIACLKNSSNIREVGHRTPSIARHPGRVSQSLSFPTHLEHLGS